MPPPVKDDAHWQALLAQIRAGVAEGETLEETLREIRMRP
jgi:hypothetical protein